MSTLTGLCSASSCMQSQSHGCQFNDRIHVACLPTSPFLRPADSASVSALQWWRANEPSRPQKAVPPAMTASLPAPGYPAVNSAAVQDTITALIAGCEQQSAQPATRAPMPRPCKQRKTDSAPNIAAPQGQTGQTKQVGDAAAAADSTVARKDDSVQTPHAASGPVAAAAHEESAVAAPSVSVRDDSKTDVCSVTLHSNGVLQWPVDISISICCAACLCALPLAAQILDWSSISPA